MGDNNANYQRAIEASLASSASAAHENANLEAALAASRAFANAENAARLHQGFASASANTAASALEDVAAEFLTQTPTRRRGILAAYRLDDYIMAGVHAPDSPLLAEARHMRDELKRLLEGGAGEMFNESDELETMIFLANEFVVNNPGVDSFPVYERLEALDSERIAEEAEEAARLAAEPVYSSSSSAPSASSENAAAIGTAPFYSSSSAPTASYNVPASSENAAAIGTAPFSSSSSSSAAAAPPLSGPALRAAMLAAAQRRMNAAAAAAAVAKPNNAPKGGRRALRRTLRKTLRKKSKRSTTRKPRRK